MTGRSDATPLAIVWLRPVLYLPHKSSYWELVLAGGRKHGAYGAGLIGYRGLPNVVTAQNDITLR